MQTGSTGNGLSYTAPSNSPTRGRAPRDAGPGQAGPGAGTHGTGPAGRPAPAPRPAETAVIAAPPHGPTTRRRGRDRHDPMHTRRRPRRRLSRRGRQIRAAVLAVLAVGAAVVGWSYLHALTKPGDDGFGIRTVEWVREHGGASAVNWAERVWYSWNAPPEGGTPADGLPVVTTQPAGPAARAHLSPPPNIAPFAPAPLPNEGVWQPAGRFVDGLPAVYVTYLRPDDTHTSLVAGVAWMDPSLLHAQYFPGLEEPGGGTGAGGARVPAGQQPSLIAAFNSGFKLSESQGGAYVDGKAVGSLKDGQASLVLGNDGSITVGQWGRDVGMTPQVAAVRQNLSLIVDGGTPVPSVDDDSGGRWGRTLGSKVFVWRSAVGVDKNGGLLYAAGDGLNVATLARLIAAAGAVRAMELDINSAWVSYYLYSGSDPPDGQKLLDDMTKPPTRYLAPGTRDFFALFANEQSPQPAAQPPATSKPPISQAAPQSPTGKKKR